MKVLISAFACEPGRGSEPGIGWNIVTEIARRHDVWLLTHSHSRTQIENELAGSAAPRIRCIYMDLIGFKGPRNPQGTGFRIYQNLYVYLWHVFGVFRARRLHREVGFDLCHHVTIGKYWMPSFLGFLGIPFLWGPVGGGESAPATFLRAFGAYGLVYELVRNTARWLADRDPLVRKTARSASLVLATSRETAARVAALGSRRIRVFSHVGFSSEALEELSPAVEPRPPRQGIRFVSVGNLIHWKGFQLGIRALAASGIPDAEYWLIGTGPDEANLRRLADRLGVSERVRFLGEMSRSSVLALFRECDVIVHPSLHESGGMAILEGMAMGLPALCLDLGGPALQVTPETGFLIPAEDPPSTVRQMAAVMRRLALDGPLREAMGEAARKRVRETFLWEHRGRELDRLYREIASRPAPAAIP